MKDNRVIHVSLTGDESVVVIIDTPDIAQGGRTKVYMNGKGDLKVTLEPLP